MFLLCGLDLFVSFFFEKKKWIRGFVTLGKNCSFLGSDLSCVVGFESLDAV